MIPADRGEPAAEGRGQGGADPWYLGSMGLLGGYSDRLAIDDAPEELSRRDVLTHVAEGLEAEQAVEVEIDDDGRLTFRSGLLRVLGSWSLLAAISAGTIDVDRDVEQVTYRLTFTALMWAASLVTIVAVAVAFVDRQVHFAALFALLWPTLVGAGYITAVRRFRRFLGALLEELGCEVRSR